MPLPRVMQRQMSQAVSFTSCPGVLSEQGILEARGAGKSDPPSLPPLQKLLSFTAVVNLNATHTEYAWPIFPRENSVNTFSVFINPLLVCFLA